MKKTYLLLMMAMIVSASQAQIADKAEDISPLFIGENIPDATLTNEKGVQISLKDVIKEKPTVLVFYRGGWCPYCNMQLATLASVEQEVLSLGYQIVAVTPDDYKVLNNTIKEDKVNYKVFSDPAGSFIQKVGIAFRTPEATKNYITKKNEGKATEILPVPTLMVLNTQGEILFEYITPNYTKRISKEMLLVVLKNIKTTAK